VIAITPPNDPGHRRALDVIRPTGIKRWNIYFPVPITAS
jgi:hypothetical protein